MAFLEEGADFQKFFKRVIWFFELFQIIRKTFLSNFLRRWQLLETRPKKAFLGIFKKLFIEKLQFFGMFCSSKLLYTGANGAFWTTFALVGVKWML